MIASLLIAIIPAGQAFACTPVRVWDGDGPIWCAEGPRVRLAAIGARELDGTCRRHQPCPAMSGTAARDVLVQLLGGARGVTRDGHVIVAGPTMRCQSNGSAKGNRTAARCTLPGIGDVGCALIRRRAALPWAWFGGSRGCQ